MTPKELTAEKATFLAKFHVAEPQQGGWQNVALGDALAAFSRRSHLYRMGLTQVQRNVVRSGWKMQLTELASAYVANGPAFATHAQFLNDLEVLQQFMNANYADQFHPTAAKGYAAGFRIAHAQKSLSLVLKRFWCNGVLGEPPCCPVDRRILVIAGATQSEARWTDVNSLPGYQAKVALLSTAAARSSFAPISLAEWELQAFNRTGSRDYRFRLPACPYSPPRVSTVSRISETPLLHSAVHF
jgi:hypothetical protein